MALPPDEEGDERGTGDDRDEHDRRGPCVVCASRRQHAVHDRDEADRDRDGAQPVDALVRAHHLALRDETRDDEQCEQRDRQVDEKDPAPRQGIDDDAGDDGAARAAETGDPTPETEGLDPLGRVEEEHCDEAERGRGGHRLAGALDEAASDEHPRRLCQPAGKRRGGEGRDADEEESAPAHDVGEPAAEK